MKDKEEQYVEHLEALLHVFNTGNTTIAKNIESNARDAVHEYRTVQARNMLKELGLSGNNLNEFAPVARDTSQSKLAEQKSHSAHNSFTIKG